jgi:hypothetical protein
MSTPRRVPRNVKKLDALKAAAAILSLLIGILLILWFATRMMHPQERQPDLEPRPAKSLWESPASNPAR